MANIWPLKPVTDAPYPKPEVCTTCPLFGTGKGFIYPEVNPYGNGVALIGEAGSDEDALQGKVFQGAAGAQLASILRRAGLQREEFNAVGNVLQCRPPQTRLVGQPYEHDAIAHCAPLLDESLSQARPRAIVALGNTPLRRLASVSGITRNRGFIFETADGVPVVGTYHPQFLLPRKKEKASAKYTWVVIMDIRKAIRVAAGQREFYPQQYLLDPSLDKAREFRDEFLNRTTFDVAMAWDLETLYKLKNKNEQELSIEEKQIITRISFAFRPGYAMTIPWTPDYVREIVTPIFEANRQKVDWNGTGFDRPIVTLQEGLVLNGELHDAMDMFHVFQPNIERNLEFAASILTDHLRPWKHLSNSEPEWYSAQDSDAEISNFLQLRSIMQGKEIKVGL